PWRAPCWKLLERLSSAPSAPNPATRRLTSMATTNHERVGKALALLSQGLAPFVARECAAKYGDQWVGAVSRNDMGTGARKTSPTDAQFLLKVMWDEWQAVFRLVLGQTERTYVSELRDVRNRWAHQDVFSTDDAYRALDT